MSEQAIILSWVLGGLAQGLWGLRLWQLGLARQYPTLFFYLTIGAVHSGAGVTIYGLYGDGPQAVIYGWFWVLSQPFFWAFHFALLLEIHGRLLSGYRGLQRLGWLAKHALWLAAGAAFLIQALNVQTEIGSWKDFWMTQQQVVYTALAACCLVVTWFAVYSGLGIPRNVRTLLGIFTLIFASQACIYSLQGYVGVVQGRILTAAGCYVSIACMAAGILLFSRAGEQEPPVGAGEWSRAEGIRGSLSGTLQRLDQTLLKLLHA